jgi:hypothetical protein
MRTSVTRGVNKGKYEYLDIALIRGTVRVRGAGEPLGQSSNSGEQSFTPHSTAENTSKTPEFDRQRGTTGERSEPENDISAGEIDSRGVISEKGSLRSPLPSTSEKEEDFAELQDLFDGDERGEQ